MQKILIDSGPLIALFDASDKYHKKSLSFIKKNTLPLVTTLASITEVLHLLDFNNIGDLTKKYKDLPIDFADACLVHLAEKLNINQIATIDRDFSIYRIKKNKKIKIILG